MFVAKYYNCRTLRARLSALNNEYVNRSRVHRILHPNRNSNNYLQLYHFRNILWVRSIYFSEDRSCSGCWRISNLQGDVCILQFENVTSFGNNLICVSVLGRVSGAQNPAKDLKTEIRETERRSSNHDLY